MYVKIKMIEVVPGQYGNVLVVKQVHAIDEAGKYIKAVKLTKNLAERIKDSPILIEQTEDVKSILAKEETPVKEEKSDDEIHRETLDNPMFNF